MGNGDSNIASGSTQVPRDQRLRIAIAVMAYGGQICVQQAQMWLELGATACLNLDRFALTSFIYLDMVPVDRARNAALGMAMQARADWLLMIDADTFVAPAPDATPGDQIIRMIENAAYDDFAVVIAPVRKRDEEQQIAAYVFENHITGTDNEGRVYGVRHYKSIDLNATERGLVPIDAGGAAVMAINLHLLGDASFRYLHGSRDQAGLGEDLEFCRQIRAAGGKLVCDTRVITGHMTRPQAIFTEIVAFSQGKTIPEIKLEVTRESMKAPS